MKASDAHYTLYTIQNVNFWHLKFSKTAVNSNIDERTTWNKKERRVSRVQIFEYRSSDTPRRYCSKWQIFAILSIIVGANRKQTRNIIKSYRRDILSREDCHDEQKMMKKENSESSWIISATLIHSSIKTRCLRDEPDFLPTVSRFLTESRELAPVLRFELSHVREKKKERKGGKKRKSIRIPEERKRCLKGGRTLLDFSM